MNKIIFLLLFLTSNVFAGSINYVNQNPSFEVKEKLTQLIKDSHLDLISDVNLNISFDPKANQKQVVGSLKYNIGDNTCDIYLNVTPDLIPDKINDKITVDKKISSYYTEFFLLHEASHCLLYRTENPFYGFNNLSKVLNYYYIAPSGKPYMTTLYSALQENYADSLATLYFLKNHSYSEDALKFIKLLSFGRDILIGKLNYEAHQTKNTIDSSISNNYLNTSYDMLPNIALELSTNGLIKTLKEKNVDIKSLVNDHVIMYNIKNMKNNISNSKNNEPLFKNKLYNIVITNKDSSNEDILEALKNDIKSEFDLTPDSLALQLKTDLLSNWKIY